MDMLGLGLQRLGTQKCPDGPLCHSSMKSVVLRVGLQELFSGKPLTEALIIAMALSCMMINLVLLGFVSLVMVLGSFLLGLLFCCQGYPVGFTLLATGLDRPLHQGVKSRLGDPLDALCNPEELGDGFIVIHDPVGVIRILPASSDAEEARFWVLSFEEACKGTTFDQWSVNHVKG